MAHELDSTNGRVSFADSRDDAWHQLGQSVGHAMTAQEALEAAHLAGWNVRKMALQVPQELIVTEAGVTTPPPLAVPDQYATVRTNPITGELNVLGVVGRKYEPMQNEESCALLDALTGESGALYQTAGAVRGGRETFVTMKLPESMVFDGIDGSKDRTDFYLAALNSRRAVHHRRASARRGRRRRSGGRRMRRKLAMRCKPVGWAPRCSSTSTAQPTAAHPGVGDPATTTGPSTTGCFGTGLGWPGVCSVGDSSVFAPSPGQFWCAAPPSPQPGTPPPRRAGRNVDSSRAAPMPNTTTPLRVIPGGRAQPRSPIGRAPGDRRQQLAHRLGRDATLAGRDRPPSTSGPARRAAATRSPTPPLLPPGASTAPSAWAQTSRSTPRPSPSSGTARPVERASTGTFGTSTPWRRSPRRSFAHGIPHPAGATRRRWRPQCHSAGAGTAQCGGVTR